MPKHTKLIELSITVEQFLDACSQTELQEVDMLIQSAKYVAKINCKHLSVEELPHDIIKCSVCGTINPLTIES
jgi:hypothetical protein